MDIHFQKCQKILCQTLGTFCLGFEVWFLVQWKCEFDFFFSYSTTYVFTQKLRRSVQECEVRPGLCLGASRGFGLKKKFFNVVLLSILITKVQKCLLITTFQISLEEAINLTSTFFLPPLSQNFVFKVKLLFLEMSRANKAAVSKILIVLECVTVEFFEC